MIEQFKKLLQETVEANYETEFMNDEALYDGFDKAKSLNLVYGQLKVFKYFAIKSCVKYLENNLNEKDYEIIEFYSNLDIDRKYVDHVWNVINYELVMQIRQLFDNLNCTDEKIIKMFDNIKYQANKRVNEPKVLSDEHKAKISTACKTVDHSNAIEAMHNSLISNTNVRGKKWYNNGITSVMAFECPEGYVPGRLNFKIRKIRAKETYSKAFIGMHWYNNGVQNIRAFECPEGFIPGKLQK